MPSAFLRRPLPPLAVCLAALLGFIPAAAVADDLDDWLTNQAGFTGGWGGWRQTLQDRGITPSASYTAEIAGNPTGGQQQGFRYAHEIDFGADFDLDTLVGLPGTTVAVTFEENAGRSLSHDKIGNIFVVQEIFDGAPAFRLAELSVEQSLFDKHLELKAGRIAAGDDFAMIDVFGNVQNAAFNSNPAVLGDNSGFTTAPIPSWGGRAKVKLHEWYLEAGAYEVNPTLVKPGNGFKFSTSGATGVIVPAEIGWNPSDAIFGLPGEYRFGGYYDSSNVDDVTGSPIRTGRWGLYLLGQQQIYAEATGSDRGLALFAGVVFGDAHTAEIQWFVEAGLVYQGTFPGRDQDTVNLGFAYGHINGRLIDAEKDAGGSEVVQSAESIVELNYGAQVTPWFTLRPGLQLVIHPDADSSTPTAVVLGVQSALQF